MLMPLGGGWGSREASCFREVATVTISYKFYWLHCGAHLAMNVQWLTITCTSYRNSISTATAAALCNLQLCKDLMCVSC